MVISIKRIILILLSIVLAVFTALNFTYSLEVRVVLAIMFALANVVSSLYVLGHWRRIWEDRNNNTQYFWISGLMEIVYVGYTAMAPGRLDGIWDWVWIGTSNLCFAGVVFLIAIVFIMKRLVEILAIILVIGIFGSYVYFLMTDFVNTVIVTVLLLIALWVKAHYLRK